MKKFLPKLSLFAGFMVLFYTFLLAVINRSGLITFTTTPLVPYVSIDTLYAYIIFIILTISACCFITVYFLETIKSSSDKEARKLEKASISNEEAVEKVKVLEAKILTLETALKEALS